MNPLVHLLKHHTKSARVFGLENQDIPREELKQLINDHLAGSKEATRLLIEGHLYLGPMIVGRYLYHYPMTSRFSDDMVSEAYLALVQGVNDYVVDDSTWFVNYLMVRIKTAIEMYINNNQSMVSSSLRTNFYRLSQGKPLEYAECRPLSEADGAEEDESFRFIDFLDCVSGWVDYDREELYLATSRRAREALGRELTEEEDGLISLIVESTKETV